LNIGLRGQAIKKETGKIQLKKLLLLFVLCGGPFLWSGTGKKITLPEVLRPRYIVVSNNRIYIAEKTTIHIYSQKDFVYIKKAGRQGEGPGEFRLIMGLTAGDNYVSGSDPARILFFSPNGEYIRELKSTAFCTHFAPLGRIFVGSDAIDENNVGYYTINLFGRHLKKGVELFRFQRILQSKGHFNPLKKQTSFYASDKTVFLNDSDRQIFCFNPSGKKINTITIKEPPLTVAKEFKSNFLDYLKNHKRLNVMYDMFKKNIQFPQYFPIIQFFRVDAEHIYVITYQQKNRDYRCVILDHQGRLLKKTYLPVRFKDIRTPFPFDIKNNVFYQVFEDEKSEETCLAVTPF
jgi:hypothetical protein